MGKPIVMGRLTHESIGCALPGRQNIVMTRQADYEADGCDVVPSIEAALAAAGDAEEIMIIGGGHVYRQFLPHADRVYLTRVQVDLEGDAFLPDLSARDWREITTQQHAADESNDYDFAFTTLERFAK